MLLIYYNHMIYQEHWLVPDHLGSLNISDNFLSIGTSGMDNHELLLGRPYGAWLWYSLL